VSSYIGSIYQLNKYKQFFISSFETYSVFIKFIFDRRRIMSTWDGFAEWVSQYRIKRGSKLLWLGWDAWVSTEIDNAIGAGKL
jgi:hypothetical protein